MKRFICLLFCLGVSATAFGQVYKWVDEKGATHYGEKPPKGVRAKEVDTQPYGVETGDIKECHTILCQGQKLEVEKRKKAEQEAASGAGGARVADEPVPVRGLDFNSFIRIQRGMTEGEVKQRAGEPDEEVTEGTVEHVVISAASSRGVNPKTPQSSRKTGVVKRSLTLTIKTYYYYPTVSNPFTTIITFRGGRVANIERIKKF